MRYALVLLLAWCNACAAQPRDGLSDAAYEVFARWMATTCIGDEAQRWNALLRRYRSELAPAFARALAEGPPEELVTRTRRAADARYLAIAAAPAAEVRIEGLTARSLARPARQGYVDGEAARFVTGYRSNAIAGLAVVGGPDARATMRRLAGQRGDPLAAAAAEALKTLPVR